MSVPSSKIINNSAPLKKLNTTVFNHKRNNICTFKEKSIKSIDLENNKNFGVKKLSIDKKKKSVGIIEDRIREKLTSHIYKYKNA